MADEHWPAYYAVTVDRPPWRTVLTALDRFEADGSPAAEDPPTADRPPSFAVDLGCGAGRDAREILRRGWRVLAIDREPAAIASLEAATPQADRDRLATRVADLDGVAIPPCDLVNASISLPFLPESAYWRTWADALAAVRPGGRVAAMLFGDRDQSAGDPTMTCPSPDAIRATLTDFEVEHWSDEDDDGQTALGEPHHWHIIEIVARRQPVSGARGR